MMVALQQGGAEGGNGQGHLRHNIAFADPLALDVLSQPQHAHLRTRIGTPPTSRSTAQLSNTSPLGAGWVG